MTTLEEKKTNRFKFLNALYEEANGSTGYLIESSELGDKLQLNGEATWDIVDYLSSENLLTRETGMGAVRLTHQGIVEVEKALSKPEEPTQYFPPVVNIMNVQTMMNSQIQQGSAGATQNVDFTQNDLAQIKDLFAGLQAALKATPLEGDAHADATAQVATVQAQLSAPKPKKQIIIEGIKSVCSVLETVASSSIAKEWLPKLIPLAAKLIL